MIVYKVNVESFCLILGLLMISAGCSTNLTIPEAISTPGEATLPPSVTSAVTIATPTLTQTPAPNLTLVPSRTPFPNRTSTPTRSPTRTPFPTLSAEEKNSFFETMFETNGGCAFPCWWGITPGETHWKEMRTELQGFELYSGSTNGTYSVLLDLSGEYEDWGAGGIQFFKKEDVVQSIHISGVVSDGGFPANAVTGSPNAYLSQFQLKDVLRRFGVPSQVYIWGMGTHSHSDTFGFYALWIEYVDLGIAIGYQGYALRDAAGYLACPSGAGLEGIELRLSNPGSTFSDSAKMLGNDKQWQELAGTSLQEFYAEFQASEFPGCLRMRYDEWINSTIILPAAFSNIWRSKEDERLPELLADNGGCDFPCWFGITPGLTPIQDVQTMFAGYGKAIRVFDWAEQFPEYEVGILARHSFSLPDYVVRQSFYVQNDVVSYIRVSGEAPVWTQSQYLSQDWQWYSLSSVLARLGVPSQVLLHYDHWSCGDTYQLAIVYDELGVLVQYGGKMRHQDDRVLICPTSEDVTRFGLVLAAPDSQLAISNQMRGCGYSCMPISLKDSVGLNLDVFYETYVVPNASDCVEVPERTDITCP